MRYTPLKQKGKHGEAMDVIRRKVWPEVLGRAKRRCEGCGARDRTLEWGHVFGRRGTGGGLGDWADTVELTAALCVSPGGEPGCHVKLDRHLDDVLALRLAWAAINRLAKTCSVDLQEAGITPDDFPATDAVRALVRELGAMGWTVDPDEVRPVRI